MPMEPTGLVAPFHEVEIACQPVSSPGFGAVPVPRLIRVPLGTRGGGFAIAGVFAVRSRWWWWF